MRSTIAGVRPWLLISGFAVASGWTGAARATDWIEPRDNDRDAGEFAPFAQIPTGIGQLTAISGRLDGGEFDPSFGSPPGVPDFQDLFLVDIAIPSSFTARCVPFGFEDIDTELFLFSVAGFGLLNNDDRDATSGFSQLVPMASDGTFNLTAPGHYVIGVAGSGNVPRSGGVAGLPIFSAVSPTEVSGPDGPGGGLVHDSWLTNEIVGRYRIELTGVQFVPSPGAGATLLAGLMVMRRRRRGAASTL